MLVTNSTEMTTEDTKFDLLTKALEENEALWQQNFRMNSVITASMLVDLAFRMKDETGLCESLRTLSECLSKFNDGNNSDE